MAPLTKLIKIRHNIELIKKEVKTFYQGKKEPTLERSDLLSILIYVVVQT